MGDFFFLLTFGQRQRGGGRAHRKVGVDRTPTFSTNLLLLFIQPPVLFFLFSRVSGLRCVSINKSKLPTWSSKRKGEWRGGSSFAVFSGGGGDSCQLSVCATGLKVLHSLRNWCTAVAIDGGGASVALWPFWFQASASGNPCICFQLLPPPHKNTYICIL